MNTKTLASLAASLIAATALTAHAAPDTRCGAGTCGKKEKAAPKGKDASCSKKETACSKKDASCAKKEASCSKKDGAMPRPDKAKDKAEPTPAG